MRLNAPAVRQSRCRLGGVLLSGLIALWLLPTADGGEQEDAFLRQHWQRPLAPQGRAPDSYTELEASLDPQACGTCHTEQLRDWRDSLHSRAMGAGVMGQLLDMAPQATAQQQACLRCHAPLAEQASSLVTELEQLARPSAKEGLHRQGIVCAACHVRQHRRFGPPRRDGSTAGLPDALPHGGWQASAAFQDSRFCAACHQFAAGDFALNGKLLENTYEEWRQSRYAGAGVSCQHCHMPARRHQWRGIHDPDMVRSGVTIETTGGDFSATRVAAQLRITNTGTGHRFPTYVTPQVVMHGYQETASGERLAGTDRYLVVARRVALNLSAEIFDTRLAPDESAILDYQMARHPRASALVLRVRVEPDHFYRRFYTSRLSANQAGRGRAMLQQALRASETSGYTLYEQRFPL